MPKKPRFGRIFQRNNNGIWWIAYYDGHNKEHRESTKSTKYTDAEALAAAEAEATFAHAGSVTTAA